MEELMYEGNMTDAEPTLSEKQSCFCNQNLRSTSSVSFSISVPKGEELNFINTVQATVDSLDAKLTSCSFYY